MTKNLRKNEYKFFKDTRFSDKEIARLSQSLSEITNLVGKDEGFFALGPSLFESFIDAYGTELIGVIFDPVEGSELGPYLGSIAAFEMSLEEAYESAKSDPYSVLPPEEASQIDMKAVFSNFDKDTKFMYILERMRLKTDYAQKEMAKLNEVFYNHACEYKYGFFSVCKERTSYKTYVKMAQEGRFKFYLDIRSTIPYLGMPETFHSIVGQFL